MENTTPKAKNPQQTQRSLFRDTRGLSTVEYVILMAIVVVGAIGAWNSIGDKFKTKLDEAKVDIGTLE